MQQMSNSLPNSKIRFISKKFNKDVNNDPELFKENIFND